MKTGLTIVGVAALLMGLLWIGQGLGYIHWPASSFMLISGPGPRAAPSLRSSA